MSRYPWKHGLKVEKVVGTYTPTGDILTVKAGGTSGINEGEAIFVFEKLNISSLNKFSTFDINFGKIKGQDMNYSNDTLNITPTFGFYHDEVGFVDGPSTIDYNETKSTYKWTENNTTSARYYGDYRNGTTIHNAYKLALKLKFKSSNLMQAVFSVTISEITLDICIDSTDYYLVLDLDGGEYTQSNGIDEYGYTLLKVVNNDIENGWTAPRKDGFTFDGWVDQNGNKSNSFYLHPSDLTYTTDIYYKAAWAKMFKIDVLPSSTSRGSTVGSGEYKEGQLVSISVNPYSGYMFFRWDDKDNTNPRIITVTSDATYTAKLLPYRNPFYLLLTKQTDEHHSYYTENLISGSMVDNNISKYTADSIVEITAVPENGYEFKCWEDGTTANPRKVIMDDDKTIKASYKKIETSKLYFSGYKIEDDYYTVLCDVYVGNQIVDVYIGDKLI